MRMLQGGVRGSRRWGGILGPRVAWNGEWMAGGGFRSVPDSPETVGPRQGGEPGRRSGETPGPAASPRVAPTPSGGQHWLDRYFPRARPWLEAQNRRWWVRSVLEARVREYPQLLGHEGLVREVLDRETERVMAAHRWRVVDERAQTHLQTAALAVATRAALLPWVRNEDEVMRLIGEHMGNHTGPLLRFLLRATRFLQRDGYAVLVSRLRGLHADYGAAWARTLDVGPRMSRLTLRSCLYHDVFSAEGVPYLSRVACCQQDAVWMRGAAYADASGDLVSAISAGDAECCFRVLRLRAAG